MGPDDDLPTLLARKDHLNVLRYIRAHQLREPALVLEHGKLLLGGSALPYKLADQAAYLSTLEQVCLAALDLQQHDFAEKCLDKLKNVVGKETLRFRVLLGRCLEASGDVKDALAIYEDVLKQYPSNQLALKRKYCLAETTTDRIAALNGYLEQNMSDGAAWLEMTQLRQTMGDYKGAIFCLEEVVLVAPLDPYIHTLLAEVLTTVGGKENLQLARKHAAQALELTATGKPNRRALFCLLVAANDYLEICAKNSSKKQNIDEHDVAVAKELVKYGADKLVKAYKKTPMFGAVSQVVSDYMKAAS